MEQLTAVHDNTLIWLVAIGSEEGQRLAYQLESFNYGVRQFQQIDEAESAVQAETPDLLILDVSCVQDGGELVSALAGYPGLQALTCPVMFVSATDDFAARVHAARLGAVGYFLKPIDVPQLVSRIIQIFELRHAPPQRVLIVDDDAHLAEYMRLVLELAGMEAVVLQSAQQIMTVISDFRPELVLMDLHMPDFSGTDLAAVIRQHSNYTNLPIVYLSAETDIAQQIEAMDQGADDFLIKPIQDVHLVTAIRSRIARARQLEELIVRDSLTGLLKHASIKDAVDREVLRSARSGKPVTVAMLDIDHFKVVNDTYGHAMGDVVIASLAQLMRQSLRQTDILGRYGGEEFVAILPECDATSAERLLNNIRIRFSTIRFRHEDKDFVCTVSIGLACLAQFPGCDGKQLLVSADRAMYGAKRDGRNQLKRA